MAIDAMRDSSMTSPHELWAWIWCRLGRPRCHRENRNGIDFAICNFCGRQSEVHEFGGPPPFQFLDDEEVT